MRKIGAIAAMLLALNFSGTANAQLSPRMHEYFYYGDPLHEELVGYMIIRCDFSGETWGYPTQYFDENWYDCP
jgi:hypothetical protein